MECENIFCIYYSNNNCLLEQISLDIQGNCKCCIYVDIDSKDLEQHRNQMLNKLK